MAVYYKFKSAKDYNSVPIEGQFISVFNLKERIFESKLFGKGTDFDLMISNAQSNEVNAPQTSNPVIDVSPANKVDEDSKIKALIDTPALDWNRRTQEGRGFGRGTTGRMLGGRSDVAVIDIYCRVLLCLSPSICRAAFEKEIEGLPTTRPVSDLPPELRCPLCKEVMKDAVLTSKCCFRSFCDKCKSHILACEILVSCWGRIIVFSSLAPNLSSPTALEQAASFILLSGIRDYIITKLMCVCGATNILADDLLPNKTLRETISRIIESTTSSTENAGSMVQVQDMESAHPLQPKDPSSTLSAVSKDEPNQLTAKQFSCVKEGEGPSETKAGNSEMNSSDKKAVTHTDVCVATAESLSKGPKSKQSPPVPGDIQEKKLAGEQGNKYMLVVTFISLIACSDECGGKKKKKKKAHLVAHGWFVYLRFIKSNADMQWRAYQDLGSENYGMPLAVSGYNPYWTGGIPLGVGNYMAPYGGPMSYMGYTPGPFDVPFGGGNFPQDPFAAQSYMMPVFPSREEYEARKADLRRKHEMERLNERLMSQSERSDRGRSEKSSSVDCGGPFVDPARHMPPRPAKTRAGDRWAPPGEAGYNKRKPSSSSERSNGPKDLKGGERRGSSGYDRESSEVDYYHFKRGPSSSSAREATSRRHRESEPRERGGREQQHHSHERPACKRR
ncbi:hypothetical protein BHM03_00027584 [Ensete ventricosum]|nr:hypothetical protein BHM03_00027584 [Ensete ventricosum]